MKTRFLVLFLIIANLSFAQVGIGNTNPNATLDISASNVAIPSNEDGILIPRVDEFPVTAPTAAQDGLMVFVTGNGTPSKGLYYWNNSNTSWETVRGASSINELNDGRSDNDGSDDGSSIFLGLDAGGADDGSNNRNLGIGRYTMENTTSGSVNIAFGESALRSNTTGFANIGFGYESLLNNNGNGNIGVGFHSLFNNNSGSDNIAIGFDPMYHHLSGNSNIAIGSQALRENTTGENNNVLGRYALLSNVTGDNNVVLGHQAMYLNTGSGNVALGYRAGYNETGNNKLYIENSTSITPLIYGEFDNDLVRVNGTLNLNNAYSLPINDGAANTVLQTDGSGNVTWQPSSYTGAVACKVRNSTSINGYGVFSEYNLIMNTVMFNVGGGLYNTGTGSYTVPSTGVYNVKSNMNISFSASPDNDLILILRAYVNGGIGEQGGIQSGATISSSYTQNYNYDFYLNLTAGDVVSFRVIATWDGTTPAPAILGGVGSGTSSISIVKIN
jgi:hypothetical protein